MIIFCFYLVLLIIQIVKTSVDVPLVKTNAGTIKGMIADDGDYYTYKGIPYGKVDPSNPFGPSLPYPRFKKIFKAFNDSAMCPQVNVAYGNTIMGTLECLQLNIYVPKIVNIRKNNATIPVMVWLYGGCFKYGYTGNFSPSNLVRHNVIVVTVNYRIGPYGFMCLNIPEVPGNQGLKDQYLAFKWIKENIGAFGGDTDLITAFGQSAGGHSIDLHLMSGRKTLFNKAILQSGTALSLTVLYEPDKLAPVKIARHLNYKTDDVKDALRFLSNTSTNLVVAAADAVEIQFKPCVEDTFDNVEPFMTKPWINTRVPKVKNMSVMMGFNEYEQAYKDFTKTSEYYKNFTIVKNHLKQVFHVHDYELDGMKDLVSHFYFGDEKYSENVKWEVLRFDSDFTYIHPVHRTMRRYLDNGAENIYFYKFCYVGGRNALVTVSDEDQNGSRICCASHTDDVSYLFDLRNEPQLSASDYTVMERMTTMWTNFAKYSDPTPTVSELLTVKWVPITKDTYYYLDIDTKLTLSKRPLHARMAFWDLFYKHYEKYQKGYKPE